MTANNWLRLIVLSILWGGTFIFVKHALVGLPPMTLTLARCAIATVILLPIALLLGYAIPRNPSQWRDFTVMSLLNNVIPFGLIFYGQTMIPSGLASVANATTPLMALLVARLLADEKMPTNKIVGVLFGIAGVAVLVGPAALEGDRTNALGLLLVVGGTLSYGLSALWGRRFRETPPIVTSAAQLLMSVALLIPLAAVTDHFWQLPIPTGSVVAATLALGIFSTALAYILFFKIMAEAGSNNAMLVTLLIPLSAIAMSAVIFGERLTLSQGLGAAIIGASLLIIDGRLFGITNNQPAPRAPTSIDASR